MRSAALTEKLKNALQDNKSQSMDEGIFNEKDEHARTGEDGDGSADPRGPVTSMASLASGPDGISHSEVCIIHLLVIICESYKPIFNYFQQQHKSTLGEAEIQSAVEAAAVLFKKVVIQRRNAKKAAEEGMLGCRSCLLSLELVVAH